MTFAPDSDSKTGSSMAVKGSDVQFKTLVVIEFSKKIPHPTMEWILSKIKMPRSQGGGELLARTALDDDGEVSHSVFVG